MRGTNRVYYIRINNPGIDSLISRGFIAVHYFMINKSLVSTSSPLLYLYYGIHSLLPYPHREIRLSQPPPGDSSIKQPPPHPK